MNTNILETIDGVPFIPTEALPDDPIERKAFLDNDENYNEGAKQWLARQEQLKAEAEKPIEVVPEVVPVVEEVVVEAKVELPVPEVTEPPKEEHNPFYQTLGMSDELYDQFVADGKIKDGKINNKFTPEDRDKFWQHYFGAETIRGRQQKELGDTRKEKEDLKFKIDQLERSIKKFEDVDYGGINTRIYSMEDGKYPSDLEPVEGQGVIQYALKQTENEFGQLFKDKGFHFPSTSEEWDEFLGADPKNSALYINVQQKYQDELKKGILALKETEHSILMQPAKEELIPLKASNLLLEALSEKGLEYSPTDTEYAKLFNKIADDVYFNHQQDPLYYDRDIFTGKWNLKPEAYVTYIKLNDKVVPELEVKTETLQPLQEATDEVKEKGLTSSLLDFEQQLRTAGVTFSIQGLEKDSEDYKIIESSVKELMSKYHNNPMFFDKSGVVQPDGFAKFFFATHPTYASTKLKAVLELDKQKAIQEVTQKQNEFYASRVPKQTDATVSLAGKIEGTKSGADRPVPPPEVYTNAGRMLNWIQGKYPNVDAAFDALEPVLKQREDRNLYGFA